MMKPADLPRRAGAQHIHSLPPEIITPFIGSFLTCGGVPGNIFTQLSELALKTALVALSGLKILGSTSVSGGSTGSLVEEVEHQHEAEGSQSPEQQQQV